MLKVILPISDREQVEHRTDRSHDLFPGIRSEHPGASGSVGEVREQDPDQNQDRSKLQDAFPISPGGFLHPQGTGRAGYAVHGSRSHPTV